MVLVSAAPQNESDICACRVKQWDKYTPIKMSKNKKRNSDYNSTWLSLWNCWEE